MKKLAVLIILSGAMLPAQTLSVGVKGGGLLTEPGERLDESRRYLVGASVELGFQQRMAVEVSALYSRVASRTGRAPGSFLLRGHAGQLPVVGKYYFSDRNSAVRPFASSGFAFRRIWFDDSRGRLITGRQDSSELGVGAVFGGGVSLRAWRLRISPEFRYIRWGGSDFPATNRNEAQALVGISF
jgi:outer membrane protein W